MFNLPLPTDSLYKFAFMFGLLLIVFSIYYNDKHSNTYNSGSTAYRIDSLQTIKRGIKYVRYKDSVKFIEIKEKFNENRDSTNVLAKISVNIAAFKQYKIQSKAEQDQFEGFFNEFDNNSNGIVSQVEKALKKLESQIKEVNSARIYYIDNAINFYEKKLAKEFWISLTLTAAGIFLFVTGGMFWYFKVQMIQDELLKLQLKETRIKTAEIARDKTSYNRKHFEPQILPRTPLRHRL